MPQLRWIVPGLLVALTVCVVRPQATHAQPAKKPAAKSAGSAVDEPPVLLQPPKTPAELFRAATLMQQLSRPNLANKYLRMLLAQKPDEATLLKLHDRFGAAKFLQLAGIPTDEGKFIGGIGAAGTKAAAKKTKTDLASTPGRELLKITNDAVRKRASNPKYVDSLINGLAGSGEERLASLTMLRNIGPAALPRVLERMTTDPPGAAVSLQTALVDYGRPAIPVLIAALNAPNPRMQTASASVLGRMHSLEATPYLWYHAVHKQAPSGLKTASRMALARLLKTTVPELTKVAPGSVAGDLRKRALEHFAQKHKWDVGADKKVEIWQWDANAKRVAIKKTTPRMASLFVGSRFAKMSLDLNESNEEAQALFVAMSLSAAADPTWEKPLPTGKNTAYNGALSAGRKTVFDALELAMKHGDSNAVIATLQVLAKLAKKSDLKGSKPPLVQALSYPDSRAQFVAATTILTIDPDERFNGSTRVVSVLSRALNDAGSPTSLVINANLQRGSILAGLMAQMGYDPQVARTGREGFRLASTRGDIELILLQVNTTRWPLTQTVANLRADSRTKSIPIAVFGPASLQDKVKRKLRYYNRTTYVTESITSRHLRMQLDPFLASIKSAPLSPTQRTARKAAAASWLAFVASGKRSAIYDLRSAESALVASVTDEQLTADVVRTLGAIPTKRSQAAIHSVVVNANANAGNRTVAARQLASHIRQYGLLLSDSQVAALKNLPTDLKDNGRFATAAAAIQGLLKPDAKRVGNSLRTIPLPKLEK